MVDTAQPSRRRNRRFLVSIWLSEPADTPGSASAQLVAGRVWEAHPAQVGQISDGRKFQKLHDVPRLLEELIEAPDISDPDQPSAAGGSTS